MGRETKILLAFLGLLSGTFVGVLSTKLLVPRPPAGAGPDVHAGFVADPSPDLVEPPSLTVRPAPPPAEPARQQPATRRPRDPFVTPAGLESTPLPGKEASSAEASNALPPADDLLPPGDLPPPGRFPAVQAETASAALQPEQPPAVGPEQSAIPAIPPARPRASSGASLSPGSGYVAVAGDSWWSLAERAYGDGRLYRALFAWNRGIDPRVSLVPGTRIELPTRQQLEASWPRLMPGR